MTIEDIGPEPQSFDLERATVENTDYRAVAWTGKHLQLTLMSIPVGGDVGLETHPDNDQFLRLLAKYRIGCVDAALLDRTIRPGSLSREDFDLDARNDLLILDRFVRSHPEFASQHRDRIRARYAMYLYEYGYRLLEHGRTAQARKALAQSMQYQASMGATKALVRSLLPRSTWPMLRA